jgi:hypothetical protein
MNSETKKRAGENVQETRKYKESEAQGNKAQCYSHFIPYSEEINCKEIKANSPLHSHYISCK